MTSANLKALSGENFETLAGIEKEKFIKKEISFWEAFLKNTNNAKPKPGHKAFENIRLSIQLLEYELPDEDFLFFSENDDDLSDVWIYSEATTTRKWMEIHAENPQVAAGFYDAIFLNKSDELTSFNALTGYLAAYEFQRPELTSFADRAATEKQKLATVYATLFKAKLRLAKKAREQFEKFSGWQQTQETAWKDRLEALEFTYEEKLRLEGPATYWARKAWEHERRGYAWAGILGVMLLAATVGLWTSFNIWLSGDHTTINLNHVEGALIFVALLSTLAFSVKALSKLAFSAFHLQRDAEEREQLTHLYLTLSKDIGVDAESRKIILQSLFSRSETGLIANESGPTMPGLTDLLSAVKKT